MPKKNDSPMIVARYGDRVAGWVGSDTGGRFSGDQEWVESARLAADVNLEFTLYEDVALKAGNDTAVGAFAALAWFAKERIRITKAPEGMMASLGLLDTPTEVDVVEDLEVESSDAEHLYLATHVMLEIDNEEVWVPLAGLQNANNGSSNEMLQKALNDVEEKH